MVIGKTKIRLSDEIVVKLLNVLVMGKAEEENIILYVKLVEMNR